MSLFAKLNESWNEIVKQIALMRCREPGLDDTYVDDFGLDPLFLQLDTVDELSGAPQPGVV
jgi:hypothetical protein